MVRMALLVGVQYPNTLNVLKGCKNDVKKIKDALICRFNFYQADIQIMVDNGRRSNIPITSNQIANLVANLSGHGNRNEYLYCTDGSRFTDEMIRKCVNMVPSGCNFTVILDCCHSGSFNIGMGATLYTSCKASQLSSVSHDHSKTHGGLVFVSKFTQVLLKVVKQERGKITTAKLFQKVSRMMKKKEKQASRRFYGINKQSPTLRCLECHKKKKFLW